MNDELTVTLSKGTTLNTQSFSSCMIMLLFLIVLGLGGCQYKKEEKCLGNSEELVSAIIHDSASHIDFFERSGLRIIYHDSITNTTKDIIGGKSIRSNMAQCQSSQCSSVVDMVFMLRTKYGVKGMISNESIQVAFQPECYEKLIIKGAERRLTPIHNK